MENVSGQRLSTREVGVNGHTECATFSVIDYGRREADRDNASRLRILRQRRLRRAGL